MSDRVFSGDRKDRSLMASQRTSTQLSKRTAAPAPAKKTAFGVRRASPSRATEGREAARLIERINRGLTEADKRADRLLGELI
jgi:hypothetical protein